MPFIAHNNDIILGVGAVASDAREHASAHDIAALWVSPATDALVASIENDGQPLVYGNHPLSALVDGVYCLPEQRMALLHGRPVRGFAPSAVRAEVDSLSKYVPDPGDASRFLLSALYGEWGSCPDYPVEDWIIEVRNNATRKGYWDWVADHINEA